MENISDSEDTLPNLPPNYCTHYCIFPLSIVIKALSTWLPDHHPPPGTATETVGGEGGSQYKVSGPGGLREAQARDAEQGGL